MPQVGTKDALALETDLFGNTLRGDVVGIGDEVDALKPKVVEPVPGEKAKSPCADALLARRCGDPVPDAPAVVVRVQAHADPAHNASVELDGERLVVRQHLPTDERERVRLRVRRRDGGDPPRDVRVIAASYDRVDVVLRPRAEQKVAIAEYH